MARLVWAAIVMAMSLPAWSATAVECLQFEVKPGGDAQLYNKCSDALNLRYCLEGDAGERSCASPSTLVVTLHYGVSEALPGYTAAGKPAVRTAVCFYPEAPIKWDPASGEYVCKKTCVMC